MGPEWPERRCLWEVIVSKGSASSWWFVAAACLCVSSAASLWGGHVVVGCFNAAVAAGLFALGWWSGRKA